MEEKKGKKSPTGTAGLINARQELTHSTHEPILMGFDELKGSERERNSHRKELALLYAEQQQQQRK